MLLPLLYVLVLAWAVSSSIVSFPLDDQRPPIARVNQPYSWTISQSTFSSPAGGIQLSVLALPTWLSFDPSAMTLSGTPAATDEGNPQVTIKATDSASSSASSTCTICVTSYPEPSVNIPLSNQFSGDNRALSSVYVVSPDSALSTSVPALRIPSRWSFSIGFQYGTFTAEHSLFYDVLQADGSSLPDWMEFNSKSLTLNGVVPPSNSSLQSSDPIPLVLHGSDQPGYSAQKLPFNIFIADHELSQSGPLPTINVTEGGPFNNMLSTADDFAGVLIDGVAVAPTNISSLSIDTSSCGWANYDSASWMLSGNPPDDLPGERIFFPVVISTFFGQVLRTNVSLAIVASYFSTSTIPPQIVGDGGQVDLDLTAYFSHATSDQSGDVKLSAAFAADGASWLTFDPTTARLSGSAPDDFSGSVHVTFTAYSSQTHSTSHTSVDISTPSAGKGSKGFTHPNNLSVTAHKKLVLALAIVFGVIGTEKGYGYGSGIPRSAMDLQNPFGPGAELVTPVRGAQDYGSLGLGLRRVAERSGSDPISPGSPQSPGVMRKGEFMTRIRQTVRNVSEKYGSRRQASDRPIISKPMPIPPTPGLPFDTSPSNPFDDSNIIRSYPGSTIMTNSPSTSTGEHSIPRRRADFAPPKSPALVHFQDGLVRQPSSGSLSSNEEAVVQVASKATSIRSGISHQSVAQRPRLVPFTSATRVPIPRVPSLSVEDPSGSPSRRVTSQRAMVLKEDGIKRSPTADELNPSTPTVSTNLRSSFSSLESSHHGHASAGSLMRTLVRAGERFKFRVAVSLYSATSYKKGRKLEAKLMSGKPLPKFLHVDLNGNKHSGAVEFYGVPGPRDLGEFNIAVYTVDDGACVGRVVVEVVAASR
ncbi:hypothetical protein B0H16DRAFT_1532492 [Mycena metata]|uniref:Dystroglycan-type cadherin-like domain-containing protein n=1 Tax=Mycena metata TaxID=1033252 RepID=A0AAD7NFV9_9AGAR|nr:hypothetical protein B0H16DRAFT_1532492 [Mycena metata]